MPWIVWQMSMGVNPSPAGACLFASGKALDLSRASVSPSTGRAAKAVPHECAPADTGTEIKGSFLPRCSCFTAHCVHLHPAAFPDSCLP